LGGEFDVTLMERRRALLAAQARTELIEGADLTWEQGAILDSGDTASQKVIRTKKPSIPMAGARLRYVGAYDGNGAIYLASVVEYDANGRLLQRSFMHDSDGLFHTITLRPDTAGVRFVFGHTVASGVNTSLSEAPLFRLQKREGGTT